jgi:CRISPR-associated protein Cas1
MPKTRNVRLILDSWGEYLGTENGCYFVKDRWGEFKKYPFMENAISEVVLRSGNVVSTVALAQLATYNVDVIITSPNNRPVAMLKNLDGNSHVETRVSQYESLHNEKGIYIANQLVNSKIKGQSKVLEKYKIKINYVPETKINSNDLSIVRKNFTGVEGRYAKEYYKNIFMLLPESIRIEKRKTYKAYDGVNNIFNLGYEILKWRVHRAILNSRLELYLGYLHALEFGKPALLFDFQELYRYMIDDFLIWYCQSVKKKDFIMKSKEITKNKIGYRIFLNDLKTDELMEEINKIFDRTVNIPALKHGEKQTIETLINQEARIFAMYLRGERKTWIPRIPEL